MTTPLRSLLRSHAAAMGGAGVVESLDAVEIEFHLVEPTFEVDGTYAARRSGQMRVDIHSGGVRVFSEGYDGEQAWQLPQGAETAEVASDAGRQALLRGVHNQLLGLHELEGHGYQLLLEGVGTVEGQAFHIVRVTGGDGHVVRRYLNADSLLIERSRERRALHPDVDPKELVIESVFSDFRTLDNGLVRAFTETQTELDSGTLLSITTVSQIRVSPEWPSGYFDMP